MAMVVRSSGKRETYSPFRWKEKESLRVGDQEGARTIGEAREIMGKKLR